MRYSNDVYDVNVLQYNYKTGDAVWCLHVTRKVGVNPKLERAFPGQDKYLGVQFCTAEQEGS